MDKETLVKNRFWIALGGAGLLVLIAWFWLLVAGSSAGDAQRDKFEKLVKTLNDSAKGPVTNANWKTPWEEYAKAYNDQKEGVWKQAWEKQKGLYTWEKVWTNNAQFNKLEYYDDEVGPDSDTARKIY